MLELKGRFASAKVFADTVDPSAITQIITLLNQPYVEGCEVRIMPDVHAGAGCTIGTTMTISGKVCPNLVGVDIGCGMETVRVDEREIDLERLDNLIYSEIPAGCDIRQAAHDFAKLIDLSELRCAKHINTDRALRSIGTLGGGNHFIEASRDSNGQMYIVVHSGSRHLGVEIANYYQTAGYKALRSDGLKPIIEKLKAEHREAEIQTTIQQIKSEWLGIPKQLAYVDGELFENYLHDMKIAQNFAELNRQAIITTIVCGMNLTPNLQFTTVHNYIDTKKKILRKGAVSAENGELLLIPINMEKGSLLCVGKGNEDWNCSAPHGAGRLMSRNEAKRSLSMAEFEHRMAGIYTTSVSENTLDECPMAYKPIEEIIRNITPTAKVIDILEPIYNFKSGG